MRQFKVIHFMRVLFLEMIVNALVLARILSSEYFIKNNIRFNHFCIFFHFQQIKEAAGETQVN